MAGGQVPVVSSGAVGDASIVRLGGVDDVRARFAAEDLEGQMLSVALCARGIAWWDGGEGGLGDGRRLGLAELVAVDVTGAPASGTDQRTLRYRV